MTTDKKLTTEQLYALGFEALGYTEIPSRSRKFRTFRHPTAPSIPGFNYFLGVNGAVRMGTGVSDSKKCTDTMKWRLRVYGTALHLAPKKLQELRADVKAYWEQSQNEEHGEDRAAGEHEYWIAKGKLAEWLKQFRP